MPHQIVLARSLEEVVYDSPFLQKGCLRLSPSLDTIPLDLSVFDLDASSFEVTFSSSRTNIVFLPTSGLTVKVQAYESSDSLDLSDPFFNHEYSLQLALAYSGVPVAFPRSFFIFSSEDHTCFRTYLVMESLSGRPFTFGWEYPLSYLREFYHQDLSLLSFYDVLGLVDLDWKPQ